MDELNKTNVTGTAATGTETVDSARDVHQATYTTTPLDSRVSSSDEGLGGAVAPVMPDPKEVTGQFDHLATRDPEAMEQRLQTPEFAGAQTTEGLLPGTGLVDSVAGAIVDHNNMSVIPGTPAGGELLSDPNSGYAAPAVSGPPHVREQPGDLPTGETAELKAEIEGR